MPAADLLHRTTAKHTEGLRHGFAHWSRAAEAPPALGDRRWTEDLILSTWLQAEGKDPGRREHRVGRSGGGFDALRFVTLPENVWLPAGAPIDWRPERTANETQ